MRLINRRDMDATASRGCILCVQLSMWWVGGDVVMKASSLNCQEFLWRLVRKCVPAGPAESCSLRQSRCVSFLGFEFWLRTLFLE